MEDYTNKALDADFDLQFMQEPKEWAAYPLLPVKRRSTNPTRSFPECGVMVDWEGHETEVFLIGLFEIQGFVLEALEKSKSIKYDSYQALIADGWMVD